MVPTTLEQMRRLAQQAEPVRLAIAGQDSASVMAAARAAESAGLARIIRVEASAAAACEQVAKLAAEGACDVVMKGSVRTDQLLHAILDKRHALRTPGLLSDVLIYEDVLSGQRRLVGVTDGGVNVQPGPDALRDIIENALTVFRALGFERPRVALLSATEIVSQGVPSTVIAQQLASSSFSMPCDVAGPLALDNALIPEAAAAKGITAPGAGRADILVAPSIEAGNILGKAVKYFGGSSCAHVIVGARVPVLIPSRVESAEDKLNSIALGAIMARALA